MLKPAALFTDGAVLCRRKEIRIFGEADEGRTVAVTLTDSRGALLAEAECICRDGRFLACLRPQEAQTGCCLIFTAGSETVTADNVAVGEVFLAGGQSNMELPLCNADEGQNSLRFTRTRNCVFSMCHEARGTATRNAWRRRMPAGALFLRERAGKTAPRHISLPGS